MPVRRSYTARRSTRRPRRYKRATYSRKPRGPIRKVRSSAISVPRTFIRKRLTIPRGIESGQVPSRKMVRMRYSDMHSLSSGANVGMQYQYRLNSINAPDITAPSAHQPALHDTFATLYRHYKVVAVSVHQRFINRGTVPTRVLTYAMDNTNGYFANPAVPLTSEVTNLIEQPRPFLKVLYLGAYSSSNPSTRSTKTVNHYIRLPRVLATNYSESGASADFGSNPTLPAVYHADFSSDNLTSTGLDVRVYTTLTYYVELSEPLTPVQS